MTANRALTAAPGPHQRFAVRPAIQRFTPPALLAAALLVPVGPAPAQGTPPAPGSAPAQGSAGFRVPPTRDANLPTDQTQAVVRTVAVPQPTPAPYPVPAPYYPYNTRRDPYYGYLEGVASVTNANGEYLNQVQQARLAQSQADMSKLDVRRRIQDEQRYERQQAILEAETARPRERAAQLERSRQDPPGPEIWSGGAPNMLLEAIQKAESEQGVRGPSIPLAPDVVRHLNVTQPGSAAGVGTLRDGKLHWPFVLQDDRFAKERQRLDEVAPGAIRYAANGSPDAKALRELLAGVAALKDRIKESVGELTPTDYIQAMRYANQLQADARTLTQPGAENLLGGKWQARGATVGELVVNMTRDGLRFAPATTGDEGYYTSLHQALTAYDAGLSRLAQR